MRSQAILVEVIVVAAILVFFFLLLHPLHADAYPAVEARVEADVEAVRRILG